MNDPLSPGGTIGILGGGQLGRMLAVAATRLGLHVHIYDPDPAAPATDVARHATHAAWTDIAALTTFAQSVDVVTYEWENVPAPALDTIGAQRPIRPDRRALETSQDRIAEKSFLNALGLATAPWAPVVDSIADAVARVGTPSILKTARMGYDGKGQTRLTDPAQAEQAWAMLHRQPCVLEGFVEFTAEISVIAARAANGQVAAFDPGLNVHRDGILHTTAIPCGLPARVATDAVLIAGRILNALDYVGVMGVELFVTPRGLLVNEIAPRVHNSGHWTQNGCAVDQFEQHIRAVAGWPLGDGVRHSDVTMENLIGDDILRVPELAREPGLSLHLYGKAESRPGRKMGHVNRVRPRG